MKELTKWQKLWGSPCNVDGKEFSPRPLVASKNCPNETIGWNNTSYVSDSVKEWYNKRVCVRSPPHPRAEFMQM